jgi:tetratricopeptide (TPR) repeat protein
LALAAPSGLPGDDAKPREPSVEDLVRDLGSPVFSRRQRASEKLWHRGRAALPALEKAADDPSPEVSRRAREILDKFTWGNFPDTPRPVLDQITAFRTAKSGDQPEAFEKLLSLGAPGRTAARAILSRHLPDEVRNPLSAHLTTVLRREVPRLLFAGKSDEAADWIALHTAGTSPEGAADYATFQFLSGSLGKAIADVEAVRTPSSDRAAHDLLLAHLYRANGDWEKARKAARDLPRQPNGSSLVEMLWEDEGNWKALLADPPPGPLNLPQALRLTLLRLDNQQVEFEAEAKRIWSSADSLFQREDARDAAFALLLNHRVVEAVELLNSRRENLGLLSEILIAQLRLKEALGLLGPSAKRKVPLDEQEKLRFELRRARVLVLTGRRDEAIELFHEVARGLRGLAAETRDWDDIQRTRRSLLRSELRSGLRELACEHAGLFVPDGQNEGVERGETVFDLIFGNQADLAELAYHALRLNRGGNEAAGATMNRVRELFDGTASKETVDVALKALGEPAAPAVPLGGDNPFIPPGTSSNRDREVDRHLARASILTAARRFTGAEKAYADAETTAVLFEAGDGSPRRPSPGARTWVFGTGDPGRPWREHGDFLVDRGRHADAAAAFEAGWKRYPDQPLLLFLSGQALARAGQTTEGRRRIELSHWVALGNERIRGKFLEELVRRGEGKAAKRETDLLLRACWSRDFYFGNVMNQVARAAALNHDWFTAERCIQRALFVLMKTRGVHFIDTAAYLNVPHEMLVFRARGLLAAGRLDEAVEQARACLDITPGHIGLASGMVPELDQIGRKREADELYARAREAYAKVLAAYPESAYARNALASLGANCRRDLVETLEHAKRAVAAEPESKSFRETLAEVHFRRGEREDAIRIMTKLAEEAPHNRLYRRQLGRYRSGDIGSPVPLREDE